MTRFRSTLTSLLLCAITMVAQAQATMRDEVNHLLLQLAQSGCEFNRNDSWYDAAKARDHLQTKYDYLLRKNLVTTTEDFIRLAGTESSMSGKPYQVRCQADAPVASATWLREELARYRRRGSAK